MNNSYIATALVIRDLNCFNLETIQDRILLQKKVYLFQDLGVSLGYGYSWYVHGPYSPDLATVAYQIIPEGSDSLRDKTIKQDFALVIKDVNDIEKEIKQRHLNISTAKWYELIASIAYWYKRNCCTKEQISKKIEETKPFFEKKVINAGIDVYLDLKEKRR